MDVVVLFFLLGLAARIAGSDLRLPEALYEALSIFLLLAIGIKGGVELSGQPLATVGPQGLAAIGLGALIPLVAFPILRQVGRLNRYDAGALAAHYGSVSVVTYAVAITFLAGRGADYESYFPVFVVLMEAPAIVVGIVLARRGVPGKPAAWGALAHEVLLGKSIVLLLGGLAIGWLAGPTGIVPVQALFSDLFKGVLALFLLEMGLVAGSRIGEIRRYGVFLVAFGVGMPIVSAAIGIGFAFLMGLSPGGTVLLATLAASASYIAAPAALRIALPEANPGLSITASLGITFPFNITLGIPLYSQMAEWAAAIGGR